MSSRNGSPPDGQRIQRNARKLNRRKVQALAAQGLSTTDIAEHQGVVRTTVWRFLEQLKPQQHQLTKFKNHRADCLAQIQGMALDVQERILERMRKDLEDEGITSALTPTAKTKILSAAVMAHAIGFDKERLERGKSTSNESLMAMIQRVDDELYPKSKKGRAKQSKDTIISERVVS